MKDSLYLAGAALIIFVVLISFLVIYLFTPEIQERNFCTPESRDADACIEIYQPVCGWYDPERIQCIRYPCATTFSNSCFACMNEDVLFWTEGECPA